MKTTTSPSTGLSGRDLLIKIFLICGILSTVLYIGADVIAAMLYEGYSYTSQAISELSAIGAPTKSFLGVTGIIYLFLVIAFGSGVWIIAGQNRILRIVAIMLMVYGLVGLLWPFAPMQQREVLETVGGTRKDTIHLILGAVDILLYLIIIGMGAALFGWRFRIYSIVTILIFLVFGTIMSMDVPSVASNESTPWLGVTERITIFSPMIWIMFLAIILLQRKEIQKFHGIFKKTNSKITIKTSMTYGGIGPRLALLCLPYIILSLIIIIKYPEFFDVKFIDLPLINAFGFIWLGLGIIFWVYSATYFLKYFKEGILITKGPFGLCRNPIYSSIIVFIIPSLALVFHSGLILSISMVLYLGFKISIHGETNVLKRIFGEEYELYEKAVNDIIPFPRYLFQEKRNKNLKDDLLYNNTQL